MRDIKLAQCGNQKAINLIVSKNMDAIKRIAGKYGNFNHELLISAGVSGVLKSIERFNVDADNTFLTYAYCWIKREILNEYIRMYYPFHVPLSVVEKSKKIFNAAEKYRAESGHEPTVQDIVKRTGISEKEVRLAMSCHSVSSYDEYMQRLGQSPDTILEHSEMVDKINIAIQSLDERARYIISEHLGFGAIDAGRSFASIGRELSISRVRVRQIYYESIQKIKKIIGMR